MSIDKQDEIRRLERHKIQCLINAGLDSVEIGLYREFFDGFPDVLTVTKSLVNQFKTDMEKYLQL